MEKCHPGGVRDPWDLACSTFRHGSHASIEARFFKSQSSFQNDSEFEPLLHGLWLLAQNEGDTNLWEDMP